MRGSEVQPFVTMATCDFLNPGCLLKFSIFKLHTLHVGCSGPSGEDFTVQLTGNRPTTIHSPVRRQVGGGYAGNRPVILRRVNGHNSKTMTTRTPDFFNVLSSRTVECSNNRSATETFLCEQQALL